MPHAKNFPQLIFSLLFQVKLCVFKSEAVPSINNTPKANCLNNKLVEIPTTSSYLNLNDDQSPFGCKLFPPIVKASREEWIQAVIYDNLQKINLGRSVLLMVYYIADVKMFFKRFS